MAIDAIVGQLNSEALGKALTKSEEVGGSSSGISFKDTLAQMDSGADFANNLGVAATDMNPTAQMVSIGGDGVSFTPEMDTVINQKPDTQRKILDMLGEVNKGQNQMDNLVNEVLYSGRMFSNQELLVIQAHVFHFAQMTELTVKVADNGISSFKAMYNTQV